MKLAVTLLLLCLGIVDSNAQINDVIIYRSRNKGFNDMIIITKATNDSLCYDYGSKNEVIAMKELNRFRYKNTWINIDSLGKPINIEQLSKISDGISYEETFLNIKFDRYNRKLPYNELKSLLKKQNDIPKSDIKKASWDRFNANAISFCGGFILGYGIGAALFSDLGYRNGKKVSAGTDESTNIILIVSGAALIGISIPFDLSFKNRTVKNIQLYNSKLN